jgi:hypothetical protein
MTTDNDNCDDEIYSIFKKLVLEWFEIVPELANILTPLELAHRIAANIDKDERYKHIV